MGISWLRIVGGSVQLYADQEGVDARRGQGCSRCGGVELRQLNQPFPPGLEYRRPLHGDGPLSQMAAIAM